MSKRERVYRFDFTNTQCILLISSLDRLIGQRYAKSLPIKRLVKLRHKISDTLTEHLKGE